MTFLIQSAEYRVWEAKGAENTFIVLTVSRNTTVKKERYITKVRGNKRIVYDITFFFFSENGQRMMGRRMFLPSFKLYRLTGTQMED